jgi:hypothetical protein
MEFHPAAELPDRGVTVLVRAVCEDRTKKYFWAFAAYLEDTACKRWVEHGTTAGGVTLWFEPTEWAYLPEFGQ